MSSTTAKLTYFSPPSDGARPFTNINANAQTEAQRKNWIEQVKQMEIENIRGKENLFSLDAAGFQFHRHPAKHTAFTDDVEIEKEYYPESIDLIKELTGASRVVMFDHSKYHIPYHVSLGIIY
jgi:hypothetical protein